MCLSPFLRGHREFRRARSRAPLPDGVLTVVGMTDGVWQCGSVMSTLRRWPCRASRHDRGGWKTPRDLAAIPKKTSAATEENPRRHLKRTATTDIIGMARGSVEEALPHQSPPGVSLFRRFCCHLNRQPALQGPQRHPPPPGVRHLAGTMAAGARKQAASCDALVLSRRPPASEAPLRSCFDLC